MAAFKCPNFPESHSDIFWASDILLYVCTPPLLPHVSLGLQLPFSCDEQCPPLSCICYDLEEGLVSVLQLCPRQVRTDIHSNKVCSLLSGSKEETGNWAAAGSRPRLPPCWGELPFLQETFCLTSTAFVVFLLSSSSPSPPCLTDLGPPGLWSTLPHYLFYFIHLYGNDSQMCISSSGLSLSNSKSIFSCQIDSPLIRFIDISSSLFPKWNS